MASAARKFFTMPTAMGRILSTITTASYYTPGPGPGIGVAGIVIRLTPVLLTLQQELIAAAAPFTVETGPIGAFTAAHDDPANDALLIDYVSTFVPKQTGEQFGPHVSTGVAAIDFRAIAAKYGMEFLR
jgi:hypothetical protein